LCHAAIHEQFRSRDVATVVGCEKHDGLGDLFGCPEPAERNNVGEHLQALLAPPWTPPGRSVRACRSGLGSLRSRECVDSSGPSSMSARTNARRLWWRYTHYSPPTLCWRRWTQSG